MPSVSKINLGVKGWDSLGTANQMNEFIVV